MRCDNRPVPKQLADFGPVVRPDLRLPAVRVTAGSSNVISISPNASLTIVFEFGNTLEFCLRVATFWVSFFKSESMLRSAVLISRRFVLLLGLYDPVVPSVADSHYRIPIDRCRSQLGEKLVGLVLLANQLAEASRALLSE